MFGDWLKIRLVATRIHVQQRTHTQRCGQMIEFLIRNFGIMKLRQLTVGRKLLFLFCLSLFIYLFIYWLRPFSAFTTHTQDFYLQITMATPTGLGG